MTSGKKRSHEEFMLEFKKNNVHFSDIQVNEKYRKNIMPISCTCKICGHKWKPLPKELLKGHGCPKCNHCLKLSNEEFIEKFKNTNLHFKDIELLQKYNGMSSKIKCRCKICGTIFSPTSKDLIESASGCPSCSGHIEFTHERFLKDFNKKNPYKNTIEICSKYNGMLKPVECRCKICNTKWYPIASSLIQGTGCPNCSKKRVAKKGAEILRKLPKPQIISFHDFYEKFLKTNPHSKGIEIIGDYVGANRHIKCKCKKCGHTWSPLAGTLIRGSGCPECVHSSTSFMEQFVLLALRMVLGNEKVEHRNKKRIGKEIDIYLPTYKFGIEMGAWIWHKRIFKQDIEKINACRNNGINLIVIYDACHVKPAVNIPNVSFYDFDLANEKGYKTLKRITLEILRKIGICYEFKKSDWKQIILKSYEKSQRRGHEDFISLLKKNNSHFYEMKILSQYTTAKGLIECQCLKCKHIWKTAASELIRGSGCPKCQIKEVGKRKSKQNIIIAWREKNSTGSKLRCEKETGISRVTIYKWWELI